MRFNDKRIATVAVFAIAGFVAALAVAMLAAFNFEPMPVPEKEKAPVDWNFGDN